MENQEINKKITRELVAKRAGVSIATVSCVLNNTRSFSEKTRKKVLNAVKELKYVPDMVARSMKINKSYQFAAIINDIKNPMFSELVYELEKEGIKHNYFLNICGGFADFEIYVNQMIARHVDGVFIAVSLQKREQSLIDRLVQNGVRIVSGGGKEYKNYHRDIIYVNVDLESGLRKHFELLKMLGHRQVAYLSAFPENEMDDLRAKIFKKLSKEYFNVDAPYIFNENAYIDSDIENGYLKGKKMLTSPRKFTAVIATNDLMAIGFIRAMREYGLRCPEDISVLGIDNNTLAPVYEPSLTTFGPDYSVYAKTIFDLLYGEDDGIKEHTVEVKHFVRESTGKVKEA